MKDTATPPPGTAVLAPAPAIDGAFLQLLQQHRGGECLHEVSQGLRELTKAVQITGKGGVLTFKLAMKPASGIRGAVAVADDVSVKLPKLPKDGSLFYANAEGRLMRDDPNQTTLDLKVVKGGPDDGAIELRKV
jgi:hypothetical protein